VESFLFLDGLTDEFLSPAKSPTPSGSEVTSFRTQSAAGKGEATNTATPVSALSVIRDGYSVIFS
jgi:hypothetical protein